MKTIILLRHGQAARHSDSSADHGRALTDRGARDAAAAGQFMRAAGVVPDHVVASSALRARSTAQRALEAGGWRAAVETTDQLYLASPEAVLDEIRLVPPDAGCVLLVGHEPGWSRTASRLMGGGHIHLPAGGLVRLDLAVNQWSNVGFGGATLRWLLPPDVFAHGVGADADGG